MSLEMMEKFSFVVLRCFLCLLSMFTTEVYSVTFLESISSISGVSNWYKLAGAVNWQIFRRVYLCQIT